MAKNTYTYRIKKFFAYALGMEVLFWLITWQLFQFLGVFAKYKTEDNLLFIAPNYFWVAVVIVLLLPFVYWLKMFKRNKLIAQFGNQKTVKTILQPVATKPLFLNYFFLRNALVFATFALMQPAFGSKIITGKSSGVEIIFAVDVSNSMNTRDIKNGDARIAVARRAINQLLNEVKISRAGLIVFAGNAYPQLPLTVDIQTAKMYVDELNTNMVSNQGTHIASALLEAATFFSNEKNNKTLVLISDGEDHEGGMDAAYKAIKEKNVATYVLGIGTEKGGPVPIDEHAASTFIKDEQGKVAISAVNYKMLEEISKTLNGELILTADAFPNLSLFLTQINSSSETKAVDLEFEVKDNRYQWPLLISLLFLTVLFTSPKLYKKKL